MGGGISGGDGLRRWAAVVGDSEADDYFVDD